MLYVSVQVTDLLSKKLRQALFEKINMPQNSKSISFVKFVGVFFLAFVLAGCAVRYGPRIPGFQPGYSDQQMGETTYQIKIGEAWPKDWPDLEKFAMFRAAEITQSLGKKYFLVLNSSTLTTSYHITSPSYSNTTASATNYGNTVAINATTVTTPGTTTTISGGWYVLDFKVLDESDLKDHPRVVEAIKIQKDLSYFIDRRR